MTLLAAAQILAGILVVSAAIQVVFAARFVRALRRSQAAPPECDRWPKAGILLSLRGGDDDLPDCLRGLMNQDYPDYELHIVVDGRQDPAWPVVERAVAAGGRARAFVDVLQNRPKTCSPHCASLAQAMQQTESCKVIALVDGDVVAHPTWLKSLVAALDDPRVGMVHGNRWFTAPSGDWGSAVRYCWNAAAVTAMHVFGIPWGGTSAMRRADMERAGIADAWLTTLNQDNPAKLLIQKIGKRVRFVPELMIENRDAISPSVCTEFLTRQMTWTRLYSPPAAWCVLWTHGVTSPLLQAAAAATVVAAAVRGDAAAMWTAAVGLGTALLTMTATLPWIERAVHAAMRRRGAEPSPAMKFFRILPAVLLTQWIYAVATWKAGRRRRIAWRGVVYEMLGPWENRVVEEGVV